MIASLSLDKILYTRCSKARLRISLSNEAPEQLEGDLYVELLVDGEEKLAGLIGEDISIEPGAVRTIEAEIPLPCAEGIGELRACFEGGGVVSERSIGLCLVEKLRREPLGVAFLWHFGPSVDEEGALLAPDSTCRVHLAIHEKHPAYRDAVCIAPSVLEAWAERRPDLLEEYRRLVERGKVEVLGTLLAEVAPTLLLSAFSKRDLQSLALELLEWGLEAGLEVIRRALGEPRGFWPPYLDWCPALTECCSRRYAYVVSRGATVADTEEVGEKGLRILAADNIGERLSSALSGPRLDPGLAARELAVALAIRYLEGAGGACILAVDARDPPHPRAEEFLDALLRLLEAESRAFKLVSLSELLGRSARPPERAPSKPPLAEEALAEVADRARWIAALRRSLPPDLAEKMLGDEAAPLYRAYKAVLRAGEAALVGAREAASIAEEGEREARGILERARLSSVELSPKGYLEVAIENSSEYPLSLVLVVEGDERASVELYVESAASRRISLSTRGKIDRVSLLAPPIVLEEVGLSSRSS